MKKINSLRLGLTYTGCFMGAGFVSGQELWQFFGSFGKYAYWGLLVTVCLFFLFGCLLLLYSKESGEISMEKIMVPFSLPILRYIALAAVLFLLFGVYVIMAAGAGALLEQVLGVPDFAGSGILCIAIVVISFFGMQGVIAAFSLLVPALIAVALLISVLSVASFGFPQLTAPAVNTNPLLGSWVISAFTYISYNFLSSIGFLAPVSRMVSKKSTVLKGIGLGCLFLFVIAASVLAAIFSTPNSSETALPMLQVAFQLNGVLGTVYALLLFGGMFGASSSAMVTVKMYFHQKLPNAVKTEKMLIPLLSVFAWLGSLFGFGKLIGVVYPFFGYLGFLILAGIALNYIFYKKKQKNAKGQDL